ncbi:MAG: hypothetical protein QOD07_158 [Frankiaceae bacterium]|nr:hypothetical protein [Frankiaceae bacterium]
MSPFDAFRFVRLRRTVLVLVFLVAIVAILLGSGVVAISRSRQFNDVERFHRARGITTGWARAGMTRPVVGEQRSPREERERSDA